MSFIGNQPTSVAFLTDTFSGNGSTTAFTLSAAPAGSSSILVAVSGVVQDPATYSVVGTTLNFSAAPPTGTGSISVRYLGIPASGVTTTAYRTVTEFTATAGQTTFTPPSYTVGYLNVYRNGVLLGSADYTATNGTTVVLAAAASAGDLVTTESFYVSSVLNALPTSGGTLNGNLNVVGSEYVSGDLGVGTASPGYKLEVYNTEAQGAARLKTVNGSYYATDLWLDYAQDDQLLISARDNNDVWFNNRTATGSLYLFTNNTARLGIDSSGRVTTPYQPAFRARQTGSANYAAGSTLSFQTVDFNIGGHYSTATNRFTAPVSGVYHFSALAFAPPSVFLFLNFRVNGALSDRIEFYGSNATYNQQCIAVLKYLNAGDYIDMTNPSGTCHLNGGADQGSQFTGFLVG